jgi:hypothetical protein
MSNRENVLEFMKEHFMSLLVFVIFGLILNYNNSPLITILVLIILSVYSYFGKAILDIIPKKVFDEQTEIDTNIRNSKVTINLIIEIIFNASMFVLFYIIKNVLRIKFIPNILIFYFAIFYIIKQLCYYKSLRESFHNFINLLFAFLLTYFIFKPNDLINYRYILTILIGYAILFLLYKILK